MSSAQVPQEMVRRVLLIDDSRFCRAIVAKQLAGENVELITAVDGESGLERARQLPLDLVLLDLTLPGWDGYETLRQLKGDTATCSIPVVILSATNTADEKAKGLNLGAIDFVTKPFEQVELRARVRSALRTKQLQDLLEQRAHLDGLTGLGNRHSLDERLAAELSVARRRRTPLAVILADLDHFKKINDTHGHRAGDEVLRWTARVLRSSVRHGEFVARFGGEEFVVLAPDCDVVGGIIMAERFRAEVERLEIISGDLKIRVTASIGVAATIDPESLQPAELLGQADSALYNAKAIGRNVVCYWDPDRSVSSPASQQAVSVAALQAVGV
jgi:diguanylate cyclase (GGDEF)-like protein